LVDNDGLVYYLKGFKGTGKEAHFRVSPVGKENRQITGVVAVGLVRGVPMAPGGLEGVLGIPHAAVAALVDMKAVGADGFFAIAGSLIGGQAGDFYTDPAALGYIVEEDHPIDLRP
jgi:hypothetical protein